ncbi:MAG: aldehyde dehydrogenase family protein [Acidobacteriia bacterium]|nr:aldehyde dehydrogenase family protein [Terriglobia bacterium]
MDRRALIVGGLDVVTAASIEVWSPFDGAPVAAVSRAGSAELESALDAAVRGFAAVRALPAWRRSEMLHEVARRLAAEKERFGRTIALEAGKPIAQARSEVDRSILTFRTAAEEAVRIGGEVLPLDLLPGNDGRFAMWRRFPVGPLACITPFNFPLNLVAHKVAPAIAAGCSFVLKPASQTPSSALDLARLMLEAGVPAEAVSVVPMGGTEAGPLVEDPRIRALSFTGSPSVGWDLRRRAGRKKVVLELGGNAGLVVDRSADLDLAASRAVVGGFFQAGQSCISVQRIGVHEDVFDPFLERLLSGVRGLVLGDPLDERTTVGPVISLGDAERIEAWVREAVDGGARILAGGGRHGTLVEPTVLTGTRPEMSVCAKEVFGPVVAVERFRSIEDAIAEVDRSDYGLQAGIFTRDLGAAMAAWERIEVGAVVVNDVPTYRLDPMPYGGVKGSGAGREGPRFAIEDCTEMRLLVINPVPPEG